MTAKRVQYIVRINIYIFLEGSYFMLQIYTLTNLLSPNPTFVLKDSIDIQKELQRSGHPDLKFEEFDIISEIKLSPDSSSIRVMQLRKK